MTNKNEIYKCPICGNIVEVVHEAGGVLVCCGENMKLMDAKELEEGNEKHKPVIEGKKVKVGSVPHPMEEEHYIEWIEATSESGNICKKFLKAGVLPEAEFSFEVISARAYCNLHGLWNS